MEYKLYLVTDYASLSDALSDKEPAEDLQTDYSVNGGFLHGPIPEIHHNGF